MSSVHRPRSTSILYPESLSVTVIDYNPGYGIETHSGYSFVLPENGVQTNGKAPATLDPQRLGGIVGKNKCIQHSLVGVSSTFIFAGGLAMTPKSFLLRFKEVVVTFLIKVLFKLRRKPAPPSQATSNSYLDTLTLDETPTLVEECTFSIELDPDVWREILSYCDAIDIVRAGMTCRSLASVAKDYRVWYFVLLRICHDRRLSYLRFHIRSVPHASLREKAILSAQLDYLSCGLDPGPFPYTTTALSLPVSTVWGISFLPGGEWLVALYRSASEDGIMLCSAKNSSGQPSTHVSVPGWHLTNMYMFTSDNGNLLVLLRSHCLCVTKLRVYSIHLSHICPSLELVWTAEVPKIENCAALGNCIVYGWIDHSGGKPRHLIKVSRLGCCYRKLTEYCTMEVEWDIGKWSHSYGLRITDSQITVIVSSTALVAAYKVPSMVPASTSCKPVNVSPFWRFSCAHMRPRSVYLVPSLPAVDTPSVIILYGNHCLFIAPSFDTDPLQRHPSCFSTYTYPRELRRPMILGPQRAFWDLGRGRVGIGMLPTPIVPGFYEHGSWDMSGIHVPEANLVHDVHPLGRGGLCRGKVARAAWDEESGRLALCSRADTCTVVIVDFKKP